MLDLLIEEIFNWHHMLLLIFGFVFIHGRRALISLNKDSTKNEMPNHTLLVSCYRSREPRDHEGMTCWWLNIGYNTEFQQTLAIPCPIHGTFSFYLFIFEISS